MYNQYGGQPYPFVQVPAGTDPELLLKLLAYLDNRKKGSDTDADAIYRILSKLEKKSEKKKKEETEAAEAKKKKEKETSTPKTPMLSLPQAFLLMMTFGLPVGALNLWIMHTAFQVIKDVIIK